MNYKQQLKEALDRLPDELTDKSVKWFVDRFQQGRDWSGTIAAAYEEGKQEGIFRVRRELLKPTAQKIVADAIGEGDKNE